MNEIAPTSEARGRAQRLSIKDLNKSFGSVHVVKNLNLQVAAGEFVVLLGPSGCGKTTALRMVAGLEAIDSGLIMLGDQDVTNVLPKYRDVAMVFQSYALYPHKTVAENIEFPLKVRGISKADREVPIREAAAQVQLSDYLERYPRQLSGGQRQRVALARAMVRRPSLFLMDEPLSNLDAKLRGNMRANLKHLQQELGTTTIYVTHDQIEAMTLAHRVAVMHGGVVQQLGTPQEIYGDPDNLFVAGFIGSPPMNFVNCSVDNGALVTRTGRIPVQKFAQGDNRILGFRPEDATVVEAESAALKGKIYSCEMTGNETIVTITVDDHEVVVRMDKDYDRPMGAVVGITVEPEKICLFNKDSGARIRPDT